MPPLLGPVMRAWAHGSATADRSRPFPTGDPVVVVEGADPDRVLLVGAGPAAGDGAAAHDVALSGTLARALAASTGRGAVVEARGAPRARVQDLPGLVRGAQLQRFDALVVCVGLEDGAAGVPVRRWRRALTAFVDDLHAGGASDATVLLVRIPPASSVGPFQGPLVVLADARIRRYNRVVERLARDRDGVVAASGTIPSAACPAGSSQWYEQYGGALAGVLRTRFDRV